MARPRKEKQTPTFTCEFGLEVGAHERRVLRSRLEASRQLYNAVLGDLLRKLNAAKHDPAWAGTRKLKGEAKREAYKALRAQYGLSEYAAHKHASLSRESWLRAHLDANTSQKTATRAWLAVEQYMYAKKGKPKFKAWHNPLDSVEGKGVAGIRYDVKAQAVLWNSAKTKHRSEE